MRAIVLSNNEEPQDCSTIYHDKPGEYLVHTSNVKCSEGDPAEVNLYC